MYPSMEDIIQLHKLLCNIYPLLCEYSSPNSCKVKRGKQCYFMEILYLQQWCTSMFGLSDNIQKILRDTGVKTRQRHCLSPQLIWKVFYSRGKENISLLPIHLANSQEVRFPEEEQLVHILGRELVALRLHDHPCCAEQTFHRSWCSRGCEDHGFMNTIDHVWY